MLAPPWLPVPPVGYGGLENVVDVLVPELMKLGHTVELFTIGESAIKASKKHSLYKVRQYKYITDPIYNTLPIATAQTLFALNKVQQAGDFDIIHSHNGFVDPLAGAYADDLPPIVHTLHGPPFTTEDRLALNLPDNLPMWRELGKSQTLGKRNNVFIVPISKALMANAPRQLKPIALKHVHNGVNPAQFPFVTDKSDYFITLGRFHPDKGWAVAARACSRLGYRLRLAGIVGDMARPKQVMMELANPLSKYRGLIDFKYFSDQIFPHLDDDRIEYVGDLSGQNKFEFISHARALLFPIQWDEPFGMVAIEALACGTPVVAMARGALPEIIQHGVNGFLARDVSEFETYMQRVDEIDPAACRKSVEDKFSARHMAAQYVRRYEEALKRRQKREQSLHLRQIRPAIGKRLPSLKPRLATS